MPEGESVSSAIGDGLAVEAIAFEALGFDGGARGGLAVNGTTEDVASGFGGGGDTELIGMQEGFFA